MPPPEFWWNPPDRPGLPARVLAPAAAIYAGVGALRRLGVRPMRPGAPVICVGNLVAGGAGKTPTVRALCERLAARGLSPHILSRGYGGAVVGPHRVDPEHDTAAMVGDEPLLLSQDAPVWVGGDRRASARAAIAAGADVLVMDDGFQNPSLVKDLSFLVIDAAVGHGNGRVIPAGPLREPLSAGFARADCAVLIGSAPPGARSAMAPRDVPTLRAHLSPTTIDPALERRPVVAFAGIGRPSKFFETLQEIGADVVEAIPFPDHHPYSSALVARLERRAKDLGAVLATTEKDAARLPEWFRDRVSTVPVRLGFSDPAFLDALIEQMLERAPPRRLIASQRPRQPTAAAGL